MSAQANIIAASELKHTLVHCFFLPSINLQPSLWPINVRISPEYIRVALDDPGVDADDGALRYEVARNGGATGRDDALIHNSKGRMDAEGLVYDGLEIREGTGVGEANILCGVTRQIVVDFVLESLIDVSVFEEIVEQRGQGDTTGDLAVSVW